MIRATTPVHKFKFPSDPAGYRKILITYQQLGKTILEINQDDLQTDPDSENTLMYALSQEQTNKFSTACKVELQVRILDGNADALASEIMTISVHRVLNDEVLDDN